MAVLLRYAKQEVQRLPKQIIFACLVIWSYEYCEAKWERKEACFQTIMFCLKIPSRPI